MARLNPRIKVNSGSLQAAMMALGLRPPAIMAALRPIPKPYHYKQSLTYEYMTITEIAFYNQLLYSFFLQYNYLHNLYPYLLI